MFKCEHGGVPALIVCVTNRRARDKNIQKDRNKRERKGQKSWNGSGKSKYEMGEREYYKMKGKDDIKEGLGALKTK